MAFNFNDLAEAEATAGGGELQTLAELRPGSVAVVASVDDGPLGRRIQDLGFVPGTEVVAVRRAPLGDPSEYELRGTRLCLRRSEASRIAVRPR